MPEYIPAPDRFRDNPALKGRESQFMTADVKVAPVLASWRESIFAHEWLAPDGKIRKSSDMVDKVRERRGIVEKTLDGKGGLDRPVLGIGILDNIEIGSGKDLFLILASRGATTISVHIPKSHEHEFRVFLR